MYIVAIGWLYVVLMMALTAKSVAAGLFTFLAWGLAPVALILWAAGGPARRRAKALREMPDKPLHPQNGADPRRDQ